MLLLELLFATFGLFTSLPNYVERPNAFLALIPFMLVAPNFAFNLVDFKYAATHVTSVT